VFWATARAYDPAVALTQARSAATDFMTERILILDFGSFGSQYTQLIGANTTTCRRF
jgi:hypothetical protein